MEKTADISSQYIKTSGRPHFKVAQARRLTLAEMQGYSVGQYLEQWLKSIQRSVGQHSFETYREMVEKHLIPALGRVPLAQLTPLDIDQYYTFALQSGRSKSKGGLSASTVAHHHRLLRGALAQAMRWELIDKNPADAVKAPRSSGRETAVLSQEQLARILKAARGSWAYTAILLAATTGARRGEVLALRWDDLDLGLGTAFISRSLQLTEAGISFKGPKTPSSRRLVTLPAFTIRALKEHRKEQRRQRLLLGAGYQEGGLVCAEEDGSPVNPGRLSKYFLKVVQKAEVPRVRFHDLRHTHATILLAAGVHPKLVSERLGHASVSVTLQTYGHVLPGMQREAARKIEAALSPALADLAA